MIWYLWSIFNSFRKQNAPCSFSSLVLTTTLHKIPAGVRYGVHCIHSPILWLRRQFYVSPTTCVKGERGGPQACLACSAGTACCQGELWMQHSLTEWSLLNVTPHDFARLLTTLSLTQKCSVLFDQQYSFASFFQGLCVKFCTSIGGFFGRVSHFPRDCHECRGDGGQAEGRLRNRTSPSPIILMKSTEDIQKGNLTQSGAGKLPEWTY